MAWRPTITQDRPLLLYIKLISVPVQSRTDIACNINPPLSSSFISAANCHITEESTLPYNNLGPTLLSAILFPYRSKFFRNFAQCLTNCRAIPDVPDPILGTASIASFSARGTGQGPTDGSEGSRCPARSQADMKAGALPAKGGAPFLFPPSFLSPLTFRSSALLTLKGQFSDILSDTLASAWLTIYV